MSEVKVNKLTPRTNCGTVTLGDSGDTFTIPSGVTITNNGTQTGFGREGSVNWQTGSIKTSTFTAVSGEGYFVDTSSGAVTANLPAGSGGAIVSFSDYTRTFGTNTLTVTPNGSEKIGGSAASAFLNVNGQAATFVYVDGTEGWINVQNAEDTEIGVLPAFVAATGGNCVTTCGDFKSHIFTGPGTFCVSNAGNQFGSNTVDYLVVAGGGGGGPGNCGAGGGGAGGFRQSPGAASGCYAVSPLGVAPAAALPVTATTFPITVGAGGASTSGGSVSTFSTISSGGGGTGGGWGNSGGVGGSGGGAGGRNNTSGSSGNTPSVSPPQGNPGGNSAPSGSPPSIDAGGAGGGAGAAGANATNCNGKDGAVGVPTAITGSALSYSGGGGSNAESGNHGSASPCGTGGAGGTPAGTNGTANRGGGGGGNGASGGSGVVIIRYRFQ